MLVNSHFEPEQVRTLREAVAELGRRRLLDLTRRAHRRTADRRVPLRLLPRGPLRDVARPRRPARARPRASAWRAPRIEAGRRCPRRSPPGRRTSWPWEWTRRTAARQPRRPPRRASETFETLTELLVELVREVAAILTYDDIPRELNLASWFVDRNVEEGRGERTALIGPTGETTYAELARLTNRSGNVLRELGVRAEERVLLVLGDSVEFVALWYGAQKIGAVTAEAYTFLQAKDYAYYLDYTRAGVVVADATTRRPRARGGGAEPLGPARPRRRRGLRAARRPRRSDELDAGADDEGRRRDLEVHDRQHRAAEGRRPPARTAPLLSFDWYARGVLDLREDDVVLPGPEALLRLRARPGGAVPVRRRRRPGSSSPSGRRRSGSSSSSSATGRPSSSRFRR